MANKTTASFTGILLIYSLLIILSFLATPFILLVTGSASASAFTFFLNRLLIWVVLVFFWLFVRYVEKEKFLLWPDKNYAAWIYILSCIAILVILLIGNFVIAHVTYLFIRQQQSSKLLSYVAWFKSSMPLLIFTAFTAGVVEEIIFRGYIQSRLAQTFRNPFWSIFISSLLFGLIHLSYGTLLQFLIPMFIGIIFAVYYWKFRNIKVLIACHFLWDFISLLALTHTK